MNIFQVIVLSIIEGLTEFLPVSSTAHLAIAQKIMGLESVNEFFTVVLQLGAILAAVYFFREKIQKILSDSIKNVKEGNIKNDRGFLMLVAIIPTLLIAFVLKSKVEQFQNSVVIIGVSSILFGIAYYIIERFSLNLKKLNSKDVSFKNLIIMGIAQGFAVIPGVSRSGITVSSGLAQGITMEDSIELSFIMGIPVMIAATLYEVVKSIHSISGDIVVYTIIGMAVAFITAIFGIKITIGYLKKKGFLPFMLYRIFFGIFVIILLR